MRKVVVLLLIILTLSTIVFANLAELRAPDNFANSTSPVNLTANVSVTAGTISNVSLFFGQPGTWGLNATNTSAVSNNSLVNFIVPADDGVYNWTVAVHNGTHLVMNGSNYTITVDSTAPNVSLISLPVNITASLLLNASVNDSLSGAHNVSFTLSRDGTSTVAYATSDSLFTSFWNVTLDTTSLSEGMWNVTVNGTDFAGGSTLVQNTTTILVDNSGPNVSIFNPVNLTNVSNASVLVINASVNDTSAVTRVQIGYQNDTAQIDWLNASQYASGLWNVTLPVSALNESFLYLSINATDWMNFSTAVLNLTHVRVDNTPPASNATLAFVNDSDSDGNVELVWVADPGESGATYRIYRHSGVINASTIGSAALLHTTVQDVTSFEDNTTVGSNATVYSYALVTVDNAGNVNLSAVSNNLNTTTNDTIPPQKTASVTIVDDDTEQEGQLTITWRNITQDVDGNAEATGVRYVIYRSGAGSGHVNTSKDLLNVSDSDLNITTYVGTTSSNSTTISDLTSNGTYYIVVTVVDDSAADNPTPASGNWNNSLSFSGELNNVVSVEVTYEPEEDGDDDDGDSDDSDSGSSSSSSGGGGGSTSAVSGTSQTRVFNTIQQGVLTTFNVTKSGIAFRKVVFSTTTTATGVEITITHLTSRPSSVEALDGIVNSYIQIDEVNLESSDIDQATITFRVAKKWISDQGIAASDVRLYRWSGARWVSLPTSAVRSTAMEWEFESVAPSLSVFAIGVPEPPVAASANLTAAARDVVQASGNESEPVQGDILVAQDRNTALIITAITIIVISIALLAGGVIIYRRSKSDEFDDF